MCGGLPFLAISPTSLLLAPELLGKAQPLPREGSPFQRITSPACTLCTPDRRGPASALSMEPGCGPETAQGALGVSELQTAYSWSSKETSILPEYQDLRETVEGPRVDEEVAVSPEGSATSARNRNKGRWCRQKISMVSPLPPFNQRGLCFSLFHVYSVI